MTHTRRLLLLIGSLVFLQVLSHPCLGQSVFDNFGPAIRGPVVGGLSRGVLVLTVDYDLPGTNGQGRGVIVTARGVALLFVNGGTTTETDDGFVSAISGYAIGISPFGGIVVGTFHADITAELVASRARQTRYLSHWLLMGDPGLNLVEEFETPVRRRVVLRSR